jgi:hypothetical protein
MEEIVNTYIALHNERASNFITPPDITLNVTSVYLVYRNPFGASPYDELYEGCLFYHYLPYVMVEWHDGDGLTTLSPLKDIST